MFRWFSEFTRFFLLLALANMWNRMNYWEYTDIAGDKYREYCLKGQLNKWKNINLILYPLHATLNYIAVVTYISQSFNYLPLTDECRQTDPLVSWSLIAVVMKESNCPTHLQLRFYTCSARRSSCLAIGKQASCSVCECMWVTGVGISMFFSDSTIANIVLCLSQIHNAIIWWILG